MGESSLIAARVVVADPPWPHRDQLPGPGRGGSKHYDLMSMAEILQFNKPLLDADCFLFLWRVASMQQEALDVCEAWGFEPKTELVWNKLTVHGKRHFGMGSYLRGSHETCIVARRGKARVKNRSQRTTFEAKVGRHSEKPEEFYQIVESVCGGPYVELFARKTRPGWISLGNEVPCPE